MSCTNFYRTYNVSDCSLELVGKQVKLSGWVHRRRDFGGLIFLDLRDRSGVVQVVLNPNISEEAAQVADQVRNEYVVTVVGSVVARSLETVNQNMTTGSVEVHCDQLSILNASKSLPVPINANADENLRLRYRYLDLRSDKMQRTLLLRHKVMQSVRKFLDQRGFVEIETPLLTKSTPEGARDYLVPSRLSKGSFYALPQSPQLFKQLLMVSGLERYFQFARCFRDEDLRADRQPEFTQIDIEASFMSSEEYLSTMEQMMVTVFQDTLGIEIPAPFERYTYSEVIEKYGSDKPDLRFGLELVDLSQVLANSSCKMFAETLANKGQVKAIVIPGAAAWSRREIDELGFTAQNFGAKGLAWCALKEDGFKGPIIKHLEQSELSSIIEKTTAKIGDLIIILADKPTVVASILGDLRLYLGKKLNLIDQDQFNLAWIVDFPLVEYSEADERYYAVHHPFTMPKPEDLDLLSDQPSKVRSCSYDLVLNGYELGGGSQRIYNRELQEKIFQILGIDAEEAKEKFGFLLDAFEYGAPPHGGIAVGLDRLVMLLAGHNNLRDCIAFPKTASGSCLLTGAPSTVYTSQLDDLHIRSLDE